MSCGCAASSLALALALALDAAGVSAAQPLVAEVSLGRNLILTAARGPPVLPRATSRLRSSPHRALRAGSRASYRDTMRRRGRASTDPSTLDPAATQFVLSIARPDPAHLRSFVEALDARLVRERLAAQVWSVVARARDCALLETRAGDAARAAAARDARLIAGAAGLTLGAAVASADVSEPAVDDDARMRCTLGTPRPPPRRANVAALTDTSARVTTGARIAIAFAAAGHESAGGTERADEASESDATVPPGLYGAARGQTRVRLDVARLGPTIVVVGTSARERPATLVRYSWTSSHVPGPRAALQVLAGARKRLIALGIPRTAIVTRVRSGPTAPANLFVDVPAGSRSGDAIASAIAGGDARVRASVGETYVRDRCDRLEARDARAAVDSARERAGDLARALQSSLRAPLALASRGVVAPQCTTRDLYLAAAPRGKVVGGPARPLTIASYASIVAAYALAKPPAIDADGPDEARRSALAPEAYFRAAAHDVSDVDVATSSRSLVARGIATRYVVADRAILNVAIASDAAHRFAAIDPRRTYALAAPLERRVGRGRTRIVVEPAGGVRLHLELRAPLDGAARMHLKALVDGARRLGTTNAQLAFTATSRRRGETAARRAALSEARSAAERDAGLRRLRLGALMSVVEAEPYVDRSAASDPRRPWTSGSRLSFAWIRRSRRQRGAVSVRSRGREA